MIEDISYRKLDIPMAKPFRISAGSTNSYEGYLVRVRTDDGITGYGEATAKPFTTGDTMGSIEYELRKFSDEFRGREESPELLNELSVKLMKSSKASRCAIDAALWDIIGKRAGLNLTRILGNYRKSIATSYTVDLAPPEQARQQAMNHLEKGVKIFKIKTGSGMAEDVERVRTVREVIGEGPTIYVDFNQAFTPRKTVEIASKFEKYDVEFIEQPVPMRDIRGMKFIRDHSNIPVFADETIFSVDDVVNLLQSESADGINIKLTKSGGITEAMRMISVAESYRAPVMIGCMIETRLASSTALAVALSRPGVKYTDLDGYVDLLTDIAEDGIRFNEGMVELPDSPGIGCTLKDEYR